MIDNISAKFKEEDKAKSFIEDLRKDKPRYIRDQLIILNSVVESLNEICINKALDYCIDNKLFRAVDFRDAAKHFSKIIINGDNIPIVEIRGFTESATDKITSKVQTRPLSEYAKIMRGNNGGK